MNKTYNAQIENKKKALDTYREIYSVIVKYFEGEDNALILQNAKCVRDGLEKIIMLKEKELNTAINAM